MLGTGRVRGKTWVEKHILAYGGTLESALFEDQVPPLGGVVGDPEPRLLEGSSDVTLVIFDEILNHQVPMPDGHEFRFEVFCHLVSSQLGVGRVPL